MNLLLLGVHLDNGSMIPQAYLVSFDSLGDRDPQTAGTSMGRKAEYNIGIPVPSHFPKDGVAGE